MSSLPDYTPQYSSRRISSDVSPPPYEYPLEEQPRHNVNRTVSRESNAQPPTPGEEQHSGYREPPVTRQPTNQYLPTPSLTGFQVEVRVRNRIQRLTGAYRESNPPTGQVPGETEAPARATAAQVDQQPSFLNFPARIWVRLWIPGTQTPTEAAPDVSPVESPEPSSNLVFCNVASLM